MKNYYLREIYFATGEGSTTIIAVGQAVSKEAFINLCVSKGVNNYYLIDPLILVEVDDIPESEMSMLKENYNSLYKRLVNNCHKKGLFWWLTYEYLNMS